MLANKREKKAAANAYKQGYTQRANSQRKTTNPHPHIDKLTVSILQWRQRYDTQELEEVEENNDNNNN